MKRTMKSQMFRESTNTETLKDIEKTYGKKAAMALDKYCKLFKKDLTNVVSDMKTDKNGMTEWDKFDRWAQRTMKVDIMDNFDDTIDWTGAEEKKDDDKEEKKRERDERSAARKITRDIKELHKNKKELKKLRKGMRKGLLRESTRMDENDILDWIFQEMGECEWVDDINYLDDDSAFEVTTQGPDGDVFKVSVQKVYSGILGKRID